MANTVSYIYEILDRYSAPLQKISNRTRHFAGSLQRAQKGVLRLSQRMDRLSSRAQNLQGAIGALGLGAGLKTLISASSDMEDAMSDIARVTNISADGLARFETKLEKLSEHLGKSKRGLAEMAFEGGKLGVTVENMEAFLMMTSRTAIAFDMVDQEAGRAIGSIQAKMGLAGEETNKLMDSLNFLADNTSANGARMIQIVERLSGTFKILELPPEVSAAFAGFADQVEVTPELAASGMQQMIRRMRRMPGMTKKLMADPIGTVNAQLERMAKMGPELRTRFMEKVFGAEASRFVEKAVANIGLFKSTVEKAMSPEAAGSMQRELENQLRRSSKAFERFSVTAKNTMDTIGDAIKPLAVSVAKSLTEMMKPIRQFAEQNPMVIKFAAAIAALIVVFSALAVTVGMLMAALAPLMTFLATFAIPIIAIVATIALLKVAFEEWLKVGHPIIAMFKDIGSDISAILTPFGELFGITSDALGEFDLLGGFIERFGFAVMAALTPVRLLLKTMRGVVEVGSAMLSGDFKGAVEAMSKTGFDLIQTGKEGIQSAAAVFGMDNSKAAASKSTPQSVGISGNISVSASGGAKVESADINLNGGANLAHGR